MRSIVTVAAVFAGVLSGAAGAQAATKTVWAGPPVDKPPKGVPQDADSNAFYRKTVTIHAGDKVRWIFAGFHTVTFPAKGDDTPGFATPDATHPVAGQTDAAGAPFWFNGQPRIALNPLAALPRGPKTYDGSKLIGSGAPLTDGPPKPYQVRFTKAGTYRYYCAIHLGNPDMKGTVKVLKRGRAVPSARRDRNALRRQFAAAIKRVKRDHKKAAPTDKVLAGVDSPVSTLFRFSPAKKTVKVGDTVTFAMSPRTSELHTVSFGPADHLSALARGLIGRDPSDGEMVLSPLVGYPSDVPAAGVLVHRAGSHGNGYLNTGFMDRDERTPFGSEAKVTFTEPGTFGYICIIHPDMKGEITATP